MAEKMKNMKETNAQAKNTRTSADSKQKETAQKAETKKNSSHK